MSYVAAPDRYDGMTYRACGKSGLRLPLMSLGLWHNFSDATPMHTQRDIALTAFDLGITHFDLANNYGPPPGSAEINFGRILRDDLAAHRDELDHLQQGGLGHVARSLRAGWRFAQVRAGEPGPEPPSHRRGVRRHLLLASVRHRHPARGDDGCAGDGRPAGQGALCRDLVLLRGEDPRGSGHPAGRGRAVAHPPAVLQPAQPLGGGGVARRPRRARRRDDRVHGAGPGAAHGQVSPRHPADARVNRPGGDSFPMEALSEENLGRVRALNDIAQRRGQSLAQMAYAWVLRDPRVTTTLIGASSAAQVRRTSGHSPTWRSRRTSWPRSTGTRSRAASTGGSSRAPTSASSRAGDRAVVRERERDDVVPSCLTSRRSARGRSTPP